MFITPKEVSLPNPVLGQPSKVTREEVVPLITALLSHRGKWFAFWEADVTHLSTSAADAARAKSRRLIEAPAMKEMLEIDKLELEYATRKREGVLTAYARIK